MHVADTGFAALLTFANVGLYVYVASIVAVALG